MVCYYVVFLQDPDEQGIAHMMEHVCFLGSRKRERLIGTGSRSNALTDFQPLDPPGRAVRCWRNRRCFRLGIVAGGKLECLLYEYTFDSLLYIYIHLLCSGSCVCVFEGIVGMFYPSRPR